VIIEELVWRGGVMPILRDFFRRAVAWLVSSALFAAACMPTLFLLGDPVAGPNHS